VHYRTYGALLSLTLMTVLLLTGCLGHTIRRSSPHALAAPTQYTPMASVYVLDDVRPSSQSDTTHVVLSVSGPVQPVVQRFSQPDRLTIDLPATQLGSHGPHHDVMVNDGRVRTIQVTQNLPDKVRITLGLQAIREYHVAVQSAPHRVVVELVGNASAVRPGSPAPKEALVKTPPLRAALPPTPLQHRGTPIIVLDPGHGGHDPGAIGPTGFEEKTAVLQIAKELRQLLQREMPQYRVMMTREDELNDLANNVSTAIARTAYRPC